MTAPKTQGQTERARAQLDAQTPPKDWIVKTASVSKATGGLSITGTNTCTTDELFREFSWDIGHHSIDDERFDWTGTVWAEGARAVFERMLRRRQREQQIGEPPTWHVVLIECSMRILAAYPETNLAAAQEFARRTGDQSGTIARVEQVHDVVMPRVGDIYDGKHGVVGVKPGAL